MRRSYKNKTKIKHPAICFAGIIICVLLLLVSLLVILFSTTPTTTTTITTTTPITYYPYVVFLNNPTTNKFCVGTLITNDTILTAAHCISDANEISILLGINDLTDNGVQLESSEFAVHKNFTNNTTPYNHDIGLIFLSQSIILNDKINTVALSNNPFFYTYEKSCFTLGWATSNNDFNDKLLEKLVSLKEECFLSNICAFGENGPYKGDSGGPLNCESTQIGIVSGGDEDNDGLSIYTDVGSYNKWIDDQILNNSISYS
ncbi:chymotrypsin-1-like isoform X2 [Tribolium madens]|uniref:chymotrypsin-1-like isoform X2 n=1 Tax=Tribolium madens TaxID=41895 RepID=UPI001CF7401D|nr:chymotrypsin-1-like isoform X2 [Tribolium madens]